jgi:hypothetical protein
VEIEKLLGFPRLQAASVTMDELVAALRRSKHLRVSEDGKFVARVSETMRAAAEPNAQAVWRSFFRRVSSTKVRVSASWLHGEW